MGHSELWDRMVRGRQPSGRETAALMTPALAREKDLAGLDNPGLLALCAVNLIQQFRAEEQAMSLMGSPEQRSHQLEHIVLARELRDLLLDEGSGQEMNHRIHAFLDRWLTHQEGALAPGTESLAMDQAGKPLPLSGRSYVT